MMNLQSPIKQKKKRQPHTHFRWYRPVAVILVLVVLVGILILRPHRNQELVEVARLSHESWLLLARWSPDEERIVTTAQDNTIKLWDRSGQLLQQKIYSEGVQQIFWNADSNRFVVTTNRYVYLWGREGELKPLSYSHPRGIYWNSIGDRFLIRSQDSIGTMLNSDGDVLGQLDGIVFDAYFQWNSQGNRLLGKESPEVVAVWDDSGQRVATLVHDVTIAALRWNSDGTQILTTSEDQIARIWDLNGGLLLEMPHPEPIGDAVWSDNGERIMISGSQDPYPLFMWDTDGNLISRMLNRSRYPLWSSDGQYFARYPRVGNYNEPQPFELHDAEGNYLATMQHSGDWQFAQAQWHPTENLILSWGKDIENENFAAYVWDLEGNLLLTIPQTTVIRQAQWSPDGERIVLRYDFTVSIWTLEGELVNKMIHSQPVSHIRWNENGTRILTKAQFPSAGVVENALWTSEGDHILTEYDGRNLNRYLGTWTRDFDRVVVSSSNYGQLLEVGTGELYFTVLK